MPAPLPPELLSEILEWAVEEAEPGERRKMRNSFRLVCRNWEGSFDYWHEVNVLGPDQLGLLVECLKRGHAGNPQTRANRLVINCLTVNLAKLDFAAAQAACIDLHKLLRYAATARHLSIVADKSIFPQLEDGQNDGVAGPAREWRPTLFEAFGELEALKNFTLCGVGESEEWPELEPGRFEKPISRWPLLELFILDKCWIGRNDLPTLKRGVLTSSECLRSVRLNRFTHPAALASFLSGLPTTLTYLDLDDDEFYNNPGFRSCLAEYLARPQLRLLQLRIGETLSFDDPDEEDTSRSSQWDNPIAGLADLQRLTINPSGLANLSGSLGSLAHLTALTLTQDSVEPEPVLAAGEVAALVMRSRSLRSVYVARRIWRKWSVAELDELRRLAGPGQAVISLEGEGREAIWDDDEASSGE